MRRRSQRISGFFLARSWWANVVLGISFYLLLNTAFDLLASRPGRLGLVAVDIFGIIPGATLVFFLMLAVASVIERRRRHPPEMITKSTKPTTGTDT
jgi:hypothetical protein